VPEKKYEMADQVFGILPKATSQVTISQVGTSQRLG